MPNVSIENATFERLQGHAKPLVDTIDSVISRALDALERETERPEAVRAGVEANERNLDPRRLPKLTHTKVLDATLAGRQIERPNWNLLLDEALRLGMKHVGTFHKLQQLCPVNMVKGRKEDDGYSYLADIDISVQGQDSNGACRGIVTIAQALGISLEIGFMWRHKENATFPGERARIRVASASLSTRTRAA
ncbi:MAG: hypothetical protein VYB05_12030 [Pseudomonadota bacterium]|nr:hypothetical protein [Pseudomonadota bacterium]